MKKRAKEEECSDGDPPAADCEAGTLRQDSVAGAVTQEDFLPSVVV